MRKLYIQPISNRLSSQCTDVMWSARRVDFLDRDYSKKSVPTQIPHDAGLESIPYIGRKFLPHESLNQRTSCGITSEHRALYQWPGVYASYFFFYLPFNFRYYYWPTNQCPVVEEVSLDHV